MGGNGTIWISNDPRGGGGQTAAGAVAAGGMGAAAAAAKDFFCGGEKSAAQQHREAVQRADNDAKWAAHQERLRVKAEDSKAKYERQQRLNNFRHYAKTVHHGKIPQVVRDASQADGTLSRRVVDRAKAYIEGASKRMFFGPDADKMTRQARELVRELPIKLSDFKWRSPDGALSDHGIVDPAELDLGYGGNYTFNQVWDESLPYYRRNAMSNFHRRIAEIYAIPAREAALAVVSEYANPGCAEGLSRFRAPPGIAHTDHSRSHPQNADVFVQEYTIVNAMHGELDRLRQFGIDSDCKSADAVVWAVTSNIAMRQAGRMENIMWGAYRNTRGIITDRAQNIARNAMVRTERGMDDFNFSHDQYLNISNACAREDLSRLAACAASVSGDTHAQDAVEDGGVAAAAEAAMRRLDVRGAAVIGITSGHRIVRAARRSPACRDAMEAYRARACMNRVLPRQVVHVDADITGSYVQPEEGREVGQ